MPAILSTSRSRRTSTTPYYQRPAQALTTSNGPPLLNNLVSTTIDQFLHSSDNCYPLLSERDYQTTLDAFTKNIRLPASPIFRRWKEVARLRDGRLFIGERLVVTEESLPAVLLSFPFSPSVDKMIRSSHKSYYGVPEALVRTWHAQLSHWRSRLRRDDEKENAITPFHIRGDGCIPGDFYPSSSRLSGPPLSAISNLYSRRVSHRLPSTTAITNFCPVSSPVDDLYAPPELAYDNPPVWVGGPGYHKRMHPPGALIKLIPFNRSSYRPTFMVLLRTWILHTGVSRPNKRSVVVGKRELDRRLARAVKAAEKARKAAKLALGAKVTVVRDDAELFMPGGFV